MVTLVVTLPPPPTTQPPVQNNQSLFTASWADWLWRLQQKVNTVPTAASTQSAIQFQDDGVNFGASGAVTGLNFVGDINNLSIVGTAITVTAQQMSLSQLLAFSAAQG